MSDVIAVFPLTSILLPGMALPLHIFEPRYRDLVRDVTGPGAPRSFGVVGLTGGSEVAHATAAGEPRFSGVGTLAEIVEARPYEDGRYDLSTVGSRRFRIRRLVAGRAYQRAEVDLLEETDGGTTPHLCRAVLALNQRFADTVARLARNRPAPPATEDPAVLGYQLASWLPLPPADRQALLEEPTDASRLLHLARLLRRELRLVQATGSIAVAPRVLQLPIAVN